MIIGSRESLLKLKSVSELLRSYDDRQWRCAWAPPLPPAGSPLADAVLSGHGSGSHSHRQMCITRGAGSKN